MNKSQIAGLFLQTIGALVALSTIFITASGPGKVTLVWLLLILGVLLFGLGNGVEEYAKSGDIALAFRTAAKETLPAVLIGIGLGTWNLLRK